MPIELDILELTNRFREENALPPLYAHAGLAKVAAQHAAKVADGLAPFSHQGAKERFAACGVRCINVAENLARSDGFGRQDLPRATLQGWCDSEGHKRNLLGPFDACGTGWASNESGTIFVTQLLALIDERDLPGPYEKVGIALGQEALRLASSTPFVCAVIGASIVGPALGGLGGGAVGGALRYRCGVQAADLPRSACAHTVSWLNPSTCAQCGFAGDLLVGNDGAPLCKSCHPTPADGNLWQYFD